MIRALVIVVLIACMAGCAGQQHADQGTAGHGRALLTMPHPPFPLESRILTQLIRSDVEQGEAVEAEFVVEVSPQRLHMIAMAPWGAPALSVTLDANGVDVREYGGFDMPVPAELMLADFILTYWPASDLAELLIDARLEQQGERSGSVRRVIAGDQTLMSIYRESAQWQGTVRLENHRHGYRLWIETLAVE